MLRLSKRMQTRLADKQLRAVVCLTNISEKSDDSNFSTGYCFHPEVHIGFWQATDRFRKPVLCHGVLDIIKCNQHGGFRRIFWKVIYFIHFYFIHFIHSSEKYYFYPEVFQFCKRKKKQRWRIQSVYSRSLNWHTNKNSCNKSLAVVITIRKIKCYWIWKESWTGRTKVKPACAFSWLPTSNPALPPRRSRGGAIENELHDSHSGTPNTGQGSRYDSAWIARVTWQESSGRWFVYHSEVRVTSHQVQALLGQFHQAGSWELIIK